jgi:hypothetical protein
VEFLRSFDGLDEALGWCLHWRQQLGTEFVETWDEREQRCYLPDGQVLRYSGEAEQWLRLGEWDSGSVPDAVSGAPRAVLEERCSEVGRATRPSGQAAV